MCSAWPRSVLKMASVVTFFNEEFSFENVGGFNPFPSQGLNRQSIVFTLLFYSHVSKLFWGKRTRSVKDGGIYYVFFGGGGGKEFVELSSRKKIVVVTKQRT